MSKPSLYSWELWTTLVAEFYCFLNLVGILNKVEPKIALASWAFIQGLFSLSRGLAKSHGTWDPHNKNNYTLIPTFKKLTKIR